MITELKVNGFKSLKNFHIRFKKGLNVFIGPNAAGKSNICQAVGLLSALAENNVTDYMLSLGGIKPTFTLQKDGKTGPVKENTLNVKCTGRINNGDDLKYRYEASIAMENELIISNERLFLFQFDVKKKLFNLILKGYSRRNKPSEFVLRVRNKELIGDVSSDILKEKEGPFIIKRDSNQSSFLTFISSLIFKCHLVKQDLRFSKAWNIDPHLARKPCDVLEQSSMLQNGTGLANAINTMFQKNSKYIGDLNDILARIIPLYSSLQPDTSDDGSTRSFSLQNMNNVKFPASCLSDGTIKIIALLVGIFSKGNRRTTIIEEPENYLHPWACRTLIEYLRDFYSNNVCIITTHSEAILNCIAPSEIIIIMNSDGFTHYKRIENNKALMKIIRQSGFGVGYHYTAGSLGGVPE